MSREIKFRGKSNNGYWYEGSYMPYPCPTILTAHWGDSRVTDVQKYEGYEVIPETVGQFTGLKDKNGKEIYEGDVVRYYGGEYCQGYWEYNETITIKDLIYDGFQLYNAEHIEVIGNIYETHELLTTTPPERSDEE